MLGTKEVTVDHFVTGRLGIFEQDLDLWLTNILTGVGVGASRFLRDLNRIGVAPHVELSRLLADHGILGLIYVVLFFFKVPFDAWNRNANGKNRVLVMVLLIVAILTTFHAAMRTFITPLFVIIGSLKIMENKTVIKSPDA
jgi:O-antigen ligase